MNWKTALILRRQSISMPKELRFDEGRTASTPDEIEKIMRFANGSGDDVVDAVSASLRLDDDGDNTPSEWGNPEDYWIAQETE